MARAAAFTLALALLCQAGASSVPRKLLVFLIDGFRHDYAKDLEALPGFKAVLENGVKAQYLAPAFPSLSYPNYYTLMTGRYCEVHQMIGNFMWDQKTNKSFDIGANEDSLLPLWWNGSEPLWVTIQNAHKNVAMYYWPGCEVEILGVRPTYCRPYETTSDANFTIAMNEAVQALRDGGADMAAVYYERVDVEGHHHGPMSDQRKDATKVVDNMLTDLLKKIKDVGLQDNLNVMLFSDHGMTDLSWMEKVIELQSYINMSDLVQMKDRGPVVNLWPVEAKHADIYQKLKAVPHMNVYEKQDIPERFNYKKGTFVAPLTLVADQGWFIIQSKEKLPFWNNGTSVKEGWQHGWHGYDNTLEDMRGFFLAYGPDFKTNFGAGAMETVDVYNIMCNVTGMKPLPNNGSWSRVESILRDPKNAALAQSTQLSGYLLTLFLLCWIR